MSSILEGITLLQDGDGTSAHPTLVYQDKDQSKAVLVTGFLPDAGVTSPTGSAELVMRNTLRKGGVRHTAISCKISQPYGQLSTSGTGDAPKTVLVNGKVYEASMTVSLTFKPLPLTVDNRLKTAVASQLQNAGMGAAQQMIDNLSQVILGAV
jgi:hypothetical protein